MKGFAKSSTTIIAVFLLAIQLAGLCFATQQLFVQRPPPAAAASTEKAKKDSPGPSLPPGSHPPLPASFPAEYRCVPHTSQDRFNEFTGDTANEKLSCRFDAFVYDKNSGTMTNLVSVPDATVLEFFDPAAKAKKCLLEDLADLKHAHNNDDDDDDGDNDNDNDDDDCNGNGRRKFVTVQGKRSIALLGALGNSSIIEGTYLKNGRANYELGQECSINACNLTRCPFFSPERITLDRSWSVSENLDVAMQEQIVKTVTQDGKREYYSNSTLNFSQFESKFQEGGFTLTLIFYGPDDLQELFIVGECVDPVRFTWEDFYAMFPDGIVPGTEAPCQQQGIEGRMVDLFHQKARQVMYHV